VFQSRPVSFPQLIERLRSGGGRRALGFGLALVIEILIILVLLTMVRVTRSGVEKDSSAMVVMNAREVSEEPPEARQPAPQQQARQQPQPQPQQPQSAQPAPPTPAPVAPPTPAAPGFIPMQQFQLSPSAPPAPAARPSRPAYNSSMYGDSERVGTAPNGEPLYAAEWYRHPDDHMLGTYLSTARGPGWGLIACRTAPEYRVEDCVPLEEYPQGSEINRSILAAAWEFRVRPPRRGGMPLVGSWVRIRIDYDLDRR
jgi:protein TonB